MRASRVRSSSVRRSVLAALTGEGMSLLSTASASLVYVACAALAGSLSVGRVVAAVQLAARVYSPFLVAVSAAITVQPALAALGRIAEAFPEPPRRGGVELTAAPRAIELRNLAFRYEGGRPLLGGLTATLSHPSLVVGEGSQRLRQVDPAQNPARRNFPAGRAKSSSTAFRLGASRRSPGARTVPPCGSGPSCSNTSLRENVLLGTEDSSEKAYRAALSASGLCDVSARLPEGDATPWGLRGRSSRAGSDSGWPSPALCCAAPTCCSSTSRRPASTPPPRPRCATCSPARARAPRRRGGPRGDL